MFWFVSQRIVRLLNGWSNGTNWVVTGEWERGDVLDSIDWGTDTLFSITKWWFGRGGENEWTRGDWFHYVSYVSWENFWKEVSNFFLDIAQYLITPTGVSLPMLRVLPMFWPYSYFRLIYCIFMCSKEHIYI